MSKGQLVTRKAEGFHERKNGRQWRDSMREWSSAEEFHGRIIISRAPRHHSHHLVCGVDEQLWFHVTHSGRHSPLPHFLLKDYLEGVGHLGYALMKKMDGSCLETSKSLPDIRTFLFVKNEVLHMLKIWTVRFWGRLKHAYSTCYGQ